MYQIDTNMLPSGLSLHNCRCENLRSDINMLYISTDLSPTAFSAAGEKITIKNLQRVSKELGDNLGDRELEAMIDEFDKDLDGSVCLEEFVVRERTFLL